MASGKSDIQAHHRHLGYLRAALAIVPGVNLPIVLQDVYYGALAIGDGWRARKVDTIGMGILSVLGGLLDIMLTVIPAGSSVASLRRALRVQARRRIAMDPFKGYEAKIKFDRVVPLRGVTAGPGSSMARSTSGRMVMPMQCIVARESTRCA